MGLDSMMAIELRQRVQRLTGISVPVSLAFDHPNLDAVTDWVLAELDQEAVKSVVDMTSTFSAEQWKAHRLIDLVQPSHSALGARTRRPMACQPTSHPSSKWSTDYELPFVALSRR